MCMGYPKQLQLRVKRYLNAGKLQGLLNIIIQYLKFTIPPKIMIIVDSYLGIQLHGFYG